MATTAAELTFQEITPNKHQIKPVNTLRLWKNRISLGLLAYDELGQPSSVKLEVDAEHNVMRITNGGPFSVAKNRCISSVALSVLEEGLYEPMGDGVFKWAVKEV